MIPRCAMIAITICLRLGQNTTMSFFGQEKSAHPVVFLLRRFQAVEKRRLTHSGQAYTTNAVGGLFILSLHGRELPLLESHQVRSSDLGDEPTNDFCRLSMNDPPTALAGFEMLD
jgi:hypothetical protein